MTNDSQFLEIQKVLKVRSCVGGASAGGDEEMEEDSTSNVEMVGGQGTFISDTGDVTVREEVRTSSKHKNAV